MWVTISSSLLHSLLPPCIFYLPIGGPLASCSPCACALLSSILPASPHLDRSGLFNDRQELPGGKRVQAHAGREERRSGIVAVEHIAAVAHTAAGE